VHKQHIWAAFDYPWSKQNVQSGCEHMYVYVGLGREREEIDYIYDTNDAPVPREPPKTINSSLSLSLARSVTDKPNVVLIMTV
jgi:hypothetical protein